MISIEFSPPTQSTGILPVTTTFDNSSVLSWSDYREISIDGLTLPDASFTFTLAWEKAYPLERLKAISKGWVVRVDDTDFSGMIEQSELKLLRIVDSVEQIGDYIFSYTCTGLLSAMTSTYDGEYYTDLAEMGGSYGIKAGDVFDQITAPFKNAFVRFQMDASLRSVTMTGHMEPCTAREALQALAITLKAALVEEVTSGNILFKMVPAASFETQAATTLSADKIFQGSESVETDTYSGVEISVYNYTFPEDGEPSTSQTGELPPVLDQMSGRILPESASFSRKFYTSSLYGRGTWFLNHASSDRLTLTVSCHPSESSTGKTTVEANKNRYIKRANANTVEFTGEGTSWHYLVCGYQMSQIVTKEGKYTASDQPNVLQVDAGPILNSDNYSGVLDWLYDYYVAEPRRKYKVKLVGVDRHVGEKVTFPLQFGGTVTGIIISLDKGIGSKQIADAVILGVEN